MTHGSRRWSVALGVLLVAAGLWPTGSPRVVRFPVEFAGCDEVLSEGPVCEIWAGGQNAPLWLGVDPPPGTRLHLRFAAGRSARVGDAEWVLTIGAPDAEGWIDLRALLPGRVAVWSLRVARVRRPAWLTADPALKQGETDAASRRLRMLEARLCNSPPDLRGAILRGIADAGWLLDRKPKEWEMLYWRAMRAYRNAGQVDGEASVGTALASGEITLRHFQTARQVLDELERNLPAAAFADAEVGVEMAYHSGVLARQLGDLRTAQRELRRAADFSERPGFPFRWVDAVGQEQALTLQDLGNWSEASATFDRLVRPVRRSVAVSSGVHKGILLSNLGWTLLMQQEAQGGGDAQARPPGGSDSKALTYLRQAERVFDGPEGKDNDRVNVRINLALAQVQAGDAAGARRSLEEADEIAAGKARDSGQRPPAAAPVPAATNGCNLDPAGAMSPEQRLWRYELQARLARAAGHPAEALRLYGCMQRLAEGSFLPSGLWFAAYGLAQVYEEMGDIERALAAYHRASELIERQSLYVPILDKPELFLALRERGTRAFLGLLVKQGRAAEAFAEARRARSGVLRQLERAVRLEALGPRDRAWWEKDLGEYWQQRDRIAKQAAHDSQLAADELARARAARAKDSAAMRESLDAAFAILGSAPSALAPLRRGELVLAYYDLGQGHWVGFAAEARGGPERGAADAAGGAAGGRDGGAVTVSMQTFRLPEQPERTRAEEWSQLLLQPFSRGIRRAERVRVLPSGALREVDFHALPFDGDILLAGRPVVYGLDLPPRPAAAPRPRAGPLRALVLGDPRGDLPAARWEAREVAEAMGAAGSGWQASSLPADASAGDLAARLDGCDLFHYAGHAQGAGGWDDMLLLAHGTHLTLADLLALRRAPAWVVLSGCDTGEQREGGAVDIPSLAHAFLLAGADGVVAAVRTVDDSMARDLSQALYQRWSGAPAPGLAVRLQQAQLELRRKGVDGWQSFRLFER